MQQPACAMRRTVCRLRAVTAAVTYVTQPISWKPRKSSGVLGYASRSHYTDTDPTERERAVTAGIEPSTFSPGSCALPTELNPPTPPPPPNHSESNTISNLSLRLVSMFREEYGLRGTLLILSALELHIVVVGMFLRPVETYR